jgi:hypothetical protein
MTLWARCLYIPIHTQTPFFSIAFFGLAAGGTRDGGADDGGGGAGGPGRAGGTGRIGGVKGGGGGVESSVTGNMVLREGSRSLLTECIRDKGGGKKFSNVLYIVTLSSEYTRALIFGEFASELTGLEKGGGGGGVGGGGLRGSVLFELGSKSVVMLGLFCLYTRSLLSLY